MSRLTLIKDKIKELGPAEFQEFCDAILEKMHPDWNVHELGMQAGRSKTTTGNPDTYFRLQTGKYCFVAYTNQETGNLYNKIKEDIEKCLDVTKTGLPVEKIDSIIVCHTSSNLKAGDDNNLHQICDRVPISENRYTSIPLTILGIDELANLVYNKYHSIGMDFLHLPIGTGQITDLEDFIRLYDSAELVAPLDTPFLFRTEELAKVLSSIRDNKITIIFGNAGVGKTRISIEACKQYAENNKCSLLCMKSKELPIYDDFKISVERQGSYIVFIDDANNFANLSAIIKHVESSDSSYKFRIVMTVRDYVREKITRTIESCDCSYKLIRIGGFSDKEISTFLKDILHISDDHYVDRIVQIAEGNPRIAYMAGKLAKTSDLQSINDSTQLLNAYYKKYVDEAIGGNKNLCKSAGILAVVRAVIYNKIESLDEILEVSGITRNQFVECLNALVEAEYAQKQDGVYIFSDQCLSNYLLYYVFLFKKMISLSDMIDIGFRHFRKGIVESSSTIINIFNNKNSVDYINDQIRKVWKQYENGKDLKLFNDFLEVFHTANPEAGFLIADRTINDIQQESISEDIDFANNWYSRTSFVLKLVSGYSHIEKYSKIALELAIKYAEKSSTNLREFYNWFSSEFDIDQDAYLYNYAIQNNALSVLKIHALDSLQFSDMCINIGAKWLSVEYNPVSYYRHGTIRSYHIEFKFSESFSEFRKNVLSLILTIGNGYSVNCNRKIKGDILALIDQYIGYIRGGMQEQIIKCEANEFTQVINLLENDLAKAVCVYRLQRICKYEKFGFPWNIATDELFLLPEWNLYHLLKKDLTESVYSNISIDDYDNLYERNIREYADTLKPDQMDDLIQQVTLCVDVGDINKSSTREAFQFENGISIIGDHISSNHELAIALIKAIKQFGRNIEVNRLESIFTNEINRDYRSFYELILNGDYASLTQQNNWQYLFFEILPQQDCDEEMLQYLLEFLEDDQDKAITSCSNRQLSLLCKFLNCDTDIFVQCSKIIFDKRKYNTFIANIYLETLFWDKYVPEFKPEGLLKLFEKDRTLLRKIYIFELKESQTIDFDGSYLYKFYLHDPTLLNDYCEYLYSFGSGVLTRMYEERGRLKILWQMDNAVEIFDEVFNYGISNSGVSSKWYSRYTLKAIMNTLSGIENLKNNLHDWCIHLVDVYANTDIIRDVFLICVNLKNDVRKDMFAKFLLLNHNSAVFESLPFDDYSVSGTPSLVPAYTKQKEFLESLLDLTDGIDLLPQRMILNQKIEDKKRIIEYYKAEDLVQNAYY